MSIVKQEKTCQPCICEQDGTLSLHFGKTGEVQSLMRLDAPDRLVLDYTRVMMGFLLFIENPKHIGMVGLGGGSMAKHCYRHLPDTRITVAEISPEIIALRNRFFIPRDDHRFHVFREDGTGFVKRHYGRFDVLLVDGFDHGGQPDQLCSREFYDDCYRALARDGVLVVNFCDSFPRTSIWRMRQCFGGRVVALDAEGSANTIVFSGKGSVWWKSAEQFNRNRMRIEQHHSIDLGGVVREFLLERESSRASQGRSGAMEPCPQN
jgi:spermidine synthase